MRVAVIDPSCFSLPYDHCLCQALAEQGCDVVLVASRYPYADWGHPADYLRWDHFYRWTDVLYGGRPSGPLRSYVKGLEHMVDMTRLVRRLRSWDPDVVHLQWLTVPVIDRWFVSRLEQEARLILTVHDSQPFRQSPSSRTQLWAYERTLRQFDRLITHTHFAREGLMNQHAIAPDRIAVIPHGVFNYYRAKSSPKKPATGVGTGEGSTILFFGIIKPYKGLDLLIQAFSRLPEELLEKAILRIAGYPRMDVRPLRELASRLGVADHIRWDLRFIPEEEVAAAFREATVVVLPYREIDASGVLMTALGFGKPLVVARIAGFTELLDEGEQACFFEPDDPADLARVLARLLRHPALARRIGEAAAKLAEGDLSWTAIAEKTVTLYRSV